MSLSPVLKIYDQNKHMEQISARGEESLIREISTLSMQLKEIDSVKNLVSNINTETDLVNKVNYYSNVSNLTVQSIDWTEKDREVWITSSFTGLYVNMVRFVSRVEKLPSLDLTSVKYVKKMDRLTKSEYLELEIKFKLRSL